mgnify:CR=1 FL=1
MIRERLHAKTDRLPETELQKLAKRLHVLDEDKDSERIAKHIALWEVLAEPIEDEEAQAEFMDAVKRRPFFSKDNFLVKPD